MIMRDSKFDVLREINHGVKTYSRHDVLVITDGRFRKIGEVPIWWGPDGSAGKTGGPRWSRRSFLTTSVASTMSVTL